MPFKLALVALVASSASALTKNGTETPKFYLKDGWDVPYWNMKVGLENHPKRVMNEAEAQLIFLGQICNAGPFGSCATQSRVEEYLNLPKLKGKRRYVLHAWPLNVDDCEATNSRQRNFLQMKTRRMSTLACSQAKQLLARKDMLFLQWDLRDHILSNDNAAPLRGVTVVPGRYYRRKTDVPKEPKYLLTYKGGNQGGLFGSSHARPDLCKAWESNKRDKVEIECQKKKNKDSYTDIEKDRFTDLLENTAFALVPHGDGRWNFRFMEAVGACAIPVVMSDGLTLPYEEIIDWSKGMIRVPEGVASNPETLMALLPKQGKVIARMRKEICDINSKYFQTPQKRADALFQSLAKKI